MNKEKSGLEDLDIDLGFNGSKPPKFEEAGTEYDQQSLADRIYETAAQLVPRDMTFDRTVKFHELISEFLDSTTKEGFNAAVLELVKSGQVSFRMPVEKSGLPPFRLKMCVEDGNGQLYEGIYINN